jgi:hypothetical protein
MYLLLNILPHEVETRNANISFNHTTLIIQIFALAFLVNKKIKMLFLFNFINTNDSELDSGT